MTLQLFKDLVERSAFGVCAYLGDILGMNTAKIRVYFIYISFVAMGSPIIIYLIAAFWINIRKYLRTSYHLLTH